MPVTKSTADFSGSGCEKLVPGTFCNVKGRVAADFIALKMSNEQIYLRCERAVADSLMSYLKPYLNFTKSTLRQLPATVYGALSSDPGLASPGSEVEQPYKTENFLVIPRFSGSTEFWHLDEGSTLSATLDAHQWYAEMVLQEDARISAATIGKYLPQDLNYDLRGYISFKKGCYTGQEIIARLHYRGTPKRRLYRAQCAAPTLCPPGADLVVGDDAKTAGSVVNSAVYGNTQYLPPFCVAAEIHSPVGNGHSQKNPDTPIAATDAARSGSCGELRQYSRIFSVPGIPTA